jgi:hypothetical protein
MKAAGQADRYRAQLHQPLKLPAFLVQFGTQVGQAMLRPAELPLAAALPIPDRLEGRHHPGVIRLIPVRNQPVAADLTQKHRLLGAGLIPPAPDTSLANVVPVQQRVIVMA